jgi:hypothetical protein
MQRHRLLLSGLVAFVLICPAIFAQQRYTGISSDTLRVLVMNASKEAVPVSVPDLKLANQPGPGLKVSIDPSSATRVAVDQATVVRTKAEPIKWEYEIVVVPGPGGNADAIRILNTEGAQGWEMVGVTFSASNLVTVVMKRPK